MRHNPGFLKLVEKAKEQIYECRIQDVKSRMEQEETFVLIDVREDHECAKGRIKGAIHKGRGILERDIEDDIPNKDAEIILYCGGGYRSALAAANLQEMGYTHVLSMDGGFRAWKEAGYPLEDDMP